MSGIRLHCLGQLGISRDGKASDGPASQPRRLALLALLAREAPKAVARDRVLLWLWPEADEEKGRRALNQALYAIRNDLGGEDTIQGTRDLRLNPDLVSADVVEYENALAAGETERAAAIYQGPFLDGFALPGAADFERWVEEERRALAERQRILLEALGEAATRKGDLPGSVRWWRQAAAQDSTNGRVALKLMRALAASGDTAAAIRQATIYQTILQSDLELPPDPEVVAYAESLKADPPRAAAAPSIPPPVAPAVAATPARIEATAPIAEPAVVSAPAVAPPRRKSVPLALVISLGTIAIALAVVFGTTLLRKPKRRDGKIPPLVTVVPLANLTGDSAFALVGLAVTDWVTQSLASTGLVRVTDSRSAFTGAEVVNADSAYLVTGSVHREGDQLRISTRIERGGVVRLVVDPVTAPTSAPTAGLETLSQRIAGGIAQLLDDRYGAGVVTSTRPPTWVAYKEYILGIRDFGRPYQPILVHFQRAIELDTGFAQARLWASMTLANLRRYPDADSAFKTVTARRDRLAPYDQASLDYFEGGFVVGDWERSHRGAATMVDLAPAAGHALWAKGLTSRITLRPKAAIETLEQIDLNTAWGKKWAVRILGEIARARHLQGQHELELQAAREMVERSPHDGYARTVEAIALAALTRYDELAQRVESAVALPDDPTTWEPYSAGALLNRVAGEIAAHGSADSAARYNAAAVAWYGAPARAAGIADTVLLLGYAQALSIAGRWSEAKAVYRKLLDVLPTAPDYIVGYGLASAHLGDSVEARTRLAQLVAMSPTYQFGRPPRYAAQLAARLGRKEDALRYLEQCIRDGHARRYLWHVDPELAPIRDLPGYRELLVPRN